MNGWYFEFDRWKDKRYLLFFMYYLCNGLWWTLLFAKALFDQRGSHFSCQQILSLLLTFLLSFFLFFFFFFFIAFLFLIHSYNIWCKLKVGNKKHRTEKHLSKSRILEYWTEKNWSEKKRKKQDISDQKRREWNSTVQNTTQHDMTHFINQSKGQKMEQKHKTKQKRRKQNIKA